MPNCFLAIVSPHCLKQNVTERCSLPQLKCYPCTRRGRASQQLHVATGETPKSRVAAYRRGQRACRHTSLRIRRGWPPVTFLVRQPVTELLEATRFIGSRD